jgi:uncharacterized membrane protein YhaH (DUF805 family)
MTTTPDPAPAASYSSSFAGHSLTYLEGRPVGFGEAVKQAFSNGFVYRGRASRSAYWWFSLFQVLAVLALQVIAFLPAMASSNGGSAGLFLFVFFVTLVISLYLGLIGLALLVRRLHDTDRSGWWVFIGFVPFVGGIILFVFTLLPGTPGPNRYEA